jgi:hypothetical protein
MQDFTIILTPQFWIAAAACGAIGFAIKQVPKVPSWIIPIVNLPLGALALCSLLGFEAINVIAGILSASVATYAYELFTNIVAQVRKK